MALIYVLTGGPCSGKTTLLKALAARGYPTIPEAAAQVILEGRHHPARDPLEFQREVLRRQLAWEAAAPEGTAFADRAVGDHFGYMEFYRARHGIDLHSGEFADEVGRAWEAARARYRAVFLLEPNPHFTPASYRREGADEALHIHRALEAGYRARHPRVIEVAWMPVDERVARVIACVKEPGVSCL